MLNLNQTDVDDHLAYALRIDAEEQARQRTTRRARTLDFETLPWPTNSAAVPLSGLTASMPRIDDDDDGGDHSDEDDNYGSEGPSTVLDDLSPRSDGSQGALARTKKSVMTLFLDGVSCNYSFTGLHDSVWHGLADNARERFWVGQCLSEHTNRLPGMDALISGAQLPKKVYDAIMADLYRTSPETAHENPLFINTLYRGLVAHAALRPEIGYVQGMNMLWANIIVCISKPHHQLMIAEHIVERVLPYYFTTDLIGAAIDASVLRYYMRRRCAKLDKVMNDKFSGELQTMCQAMTSSWFTTLFGVHLPPSQRKRLWDMIMLRGGVVLFEFLLRIFIYSQKHNWLYRCATWPDYKAKIEERLTDMVSIDGILKTRLPNGRIVYEDFEARRRVATRITFAMLQESPRWQK